ncbi:MAG TPA: cation:proton antiporter [Candidatus Limnocylindrales bacterium]|nr:cation:proton antiporter [Candidatus Limnocylindrales bacterium]
MEHLDIPKFLGLMVIMLGMAKLAGALAQRIGQPAVLGELIAGMILGPSVLGLVDPNIEVIHLLAEVGVIILLFEIGLETDLKKLLQVGGASTVVAIVGVALPFILGYMVCWFLGLSNLVAIVAGAALTATSVGITARVLSDLGRLQEPESQIVLGAAIIDDIIGLIILTVVAGLTQGQEVTIFQVIKITGIAFGFLIITLLLGSLIVPLLFRWVGQIDLSGTLTVPAVILAFSLAWLADQAGSAMIMGAFTAGLLLVKIPQAHEIEVGIAHLGHFFVPLFFISVGAAVDVRVLNPANPANRQTLLIGSLLVIAAISGKFLAGYAPFWFRGKKSVIGVGMIPRGEVGLIFAQMGLSSGVFNLRLFSAITLMVMITTFIAPPLLKFLFPAKQPGREPPEPEGIEDLVTKP